jgi:hypothetical protein
MANYPNIVVNGYVLVYKPEHHLADKRGYIKRARLVLEEKIGRFLTKQEVTHHIDHNRSNDSPENLQLMPDKKFHNDFHAKLREDRVTFICQWCGKSKTVKRSRRKEGKGKFCSKSCKGKWQWNTNHISNTFKRTAYLKQGLNKKLKEDEQHGI